jgi:hypothetical protein
MRNGFVERYRADDENGDVDGLPPGEGAFLPCSFWLAAVRHRQGRHDEASAFLERAVSLNPSFALASTARSYHAVMSGAFEAAICALATRDRWLPPTVNLQDPDPACDLAFLRGDGAAADPEYLLSNSFGFGGINAALLFRRLDGR